MPPVRRKFVLINPKFQIRFSLYVCLWLLALSFIYPLVVYNLFEYFIRYASLDPTGPDLSSLYKTRNEVLWLLFFTEGTFLGLTFLNSLFISHRIAGPIYKLRKFMSEASSGNLEQNISFRQKDHFRELADDYNKLLASVRSQLEGSKGDTASAAIVHLERALQQLGSGSPDARRELEQALSTLRASAGR